MSNHYVSSMITVNADTMTWILLLQFPNHFQVGFRFAKIGQSLREKLDVADSAGEVFGVVTGLRCYVEPVQAAKEMYVEGEAAAITSGDTNWAILNRLLFAYVSFGWEPILQLLRSAIYMFTHYFRAFFHFNEQLYIKAALFFRHHEHKISLA